MATRTLGKASDEKNVKVAPETLSKYVGSYEFKIPETGQLLTVAFAVEGDRLVMRGAGATIEFVANDAGAVNAAILRVVEGDFRGARK